MAGPRGGVIPDGVTTNAPAPTRPSNLRRLAPWVGLALALAAGMALRLVFPGDIEWKTDERWTFDQAMAMLAGGPWPPIGMPSSVGSPNPGLSLWALTGLAGLVGAKTGPDLARAVQLLNCLALLALTAFAFLVVRKEKREPWLWAVALWALNPVAMVYERKIWPPSILPLATIGLIWAWWYRRKPAAAFAWGALGALMAQVHMGVAFLAVVIAAWTWAYDGKAFAWKAWLAGSVAGCLPAIPWVLEILQHGSGSKMHWQGPIAQFYLRWFTQPFGFGIDFTLGRKALADYLAGPVIDGAATHILGGVYIALGGLLLIVLVQAALRVRATGPMTARQIFLGDEPQTVLITASFWGYGAVLALISMAGTNSPRHYMIVIAPLMALWAAMAVLYGDRSPGRWRAKSLLVAICLCQLALSAGFLAYVHQKGVISGDYGATWQAQQNVAVVSARPPTPPPPIP